MCLSLGRFNSNNTMGKHYNILKQNLLTFVASCTETTTDLTKVLSVITTWEW